MLSKDSIVKSSDEIIKLDDGTLIQHGNFNDRIYLMTLGADASEKLPAKLISLAKKFKYSKIIAKVPSKKAEHFLDNGFIMEAVIPNLYNFRDAGLFLVFYLMKTRAVEENIETYEKVRSTAYKKKHSKISPIDMNLFLVRRCSEKDAVQMSEIYRYVFPTYPFPIQNPEFLQKSMRKNVMFFCVESLVDNKLVALSSAELSKSAGNAEMTDFATLSKWRSKGLGAHLLAEMEKELKSKGIKIFWTIARASSTGMNVTFAKLGYHFGGRLKNNTNISGNIESMNIWYKNIN